MSLSTPMQKVDSKCCCCYLFNRRKKTNRLFSDAREHIYDVRPVINTSCTSRRPLLQLREHHGLGILEPVSDDHRRLEQCPERGRPEMRKKIGGCKNFATVSVLPFKAGLLRSCARRTVAKKWPKNQTKAFVLFWPPLPDKKGGRTKLVTAGGFLRHLGFRLPWKKAFKNFRLWRLFYSRVVPPSQSGKAQILSLAQLSCSRTHAPRGCSCKVESRDVEVTSGWSNFEMIENY